MTQDPVHAAAAFFEATTLWAEALQNIYGGADAKETLDALVEDIESTVE